MFDLMDFEVELSQAGNPVYAVFFFTGLDLLTDTQAAHALQHQLSGHVMPDLLVFLMPGYVLDDFRAQQAAATSPLMAELSRKGPGSPRTYACAFYDVDGAITEYVHVSGPKRRFETLIKSNSSEIAKAGLNHLVDRSDVLKKAPAGFFYSKPSSRASNYFIRAEDLLSETLHAHYLAFTCLPLIKKATEDGMAAPDTLYLDTIALLPLGMAMQMYLMRFGLGGFANIRSFHSHEGLVKDGPLPKAVSALCLISASSQCGLAQQWLKVNSASPTRVATLLSFDEASSSCTILHALKKPEDFEVLGEGEAGGIRLIRIHGERFVAEHSETKVLNIGIDHAPDSLQAKFYSFMGADLFSCYTQDRPGLRPRTVHVHKDSLVVASDFGGWYERVLREEAVASTKWIIHDDDPASEALADRAIVYLASCGVTVENKVSFDRFDASVNFEGSVIVIAAAAERGSRLLSVSRRLRTAQNAEKPGTRLYITGALFGRSYQMMKELQSNLTQPPKGHSRYVFKTFVEIPAAELACTSHWVEEQRLLGSLHSVTTTFSPAFTQRMAVFDNAAAGGLGLNPFWPSSLTGLPMKLSRGFAFVDGKKDVREASSTDIYLTILWILQNARYSDKVQNAKRLESGELQQVLLSPDVFSRFDDGVIQGAFLRAALSTELDYRAQETHSLSMADIIQRVAAGYGQERGEAAMEFVMALAIGKIRLHKDVDSRLRASLIAMLSPHVPETLYLLDPEYEPPL
ncbi:hypothetical protein [Pseudomonas syringae]|uniref:hypothetical protein n=1 Tax=Pseudomonas syringae TaxID=317 RepID=UPI001F387DDD|nr:hypothetical protein [Pseudomonas syringae]MCF5199899.1 hypothetical protein [Pseudomonas syringae]MCF5209298.1 hypothetical protein [Pseudomonas syringae]MCF5214957.1 hypothetical protein [Pseudomonas syringae]MCF5220685.1 hypothetical protein [Pseudomonas syringae]MCF5266659.1 hypothetical protein [Pseudomonas syringae]